MTNLVDQFRCLTRYHQAKHVKLKITLYFREYEFIKNDFDLEDTFYRKKIIICNTLDNFLIHPYSLK